MQIEYNNSLISLLSGLIVMGGCSWGWGMIYWESVATIKYMGGKGNIIKS